MHTGDWRRLHMEDLTTSEFQWLWDKNVDLTICMGHLTHTGVNRKRIHDSNRNWGQFITLQLWKMVKCGYPHQHVHPIGPFDMITCILQTSFLSVILHYNVQFFISMGPLTHFLMRCWFCAESSYFCIYHHLAEFLIIESDLDLEIPDYENLLQISLNLHLMIKRIPKKKKLVINQFLLFLRWRFEVKV